MKIINWKVILLITVNFVLISNTLLSITIECNGEVMSEKQFIESNSMTMCFSKLIMTQKEMEDSSYYDSCSKKYEHFYNDNTGAVCSEIAQKGGFRDKQNMLSDPKKHLDCIGGEIGAGDRLLYRKVIKEYILSCVHSGEKSSIAVNKLLHSIQRGQEAEAKRIRNCLEGGGSTSTCYNTNSDNDEIDELKERIEELESDLYSLKNQ